MNLEINSNLAENVGYLIKYTENKTILDTLIDKIVELINRIFNTKLRFKVGLENKINEVVGFFNHHLNYIQEIEEFNDLISYVFFDVLKNFGKEFDRTKISNQIKKRLYELISTKTDGDVVKTAKLAHKLGISTIGNKGANSSEIFLDLSHKGIGIFKPGAKGFSLSLRKRIENCISNYFHKTFSNIRDIRGQDSFLPLQRELATRAMLSERASYLLSRHLGLDLVPKTEIVSLKGKQGSFQHFVQDHVESDLVTIPSKDQANNTDLEKFQVFALLDYVLGNLDRKGDNWLVKISEDNHIESIAMIDNANCFPETLLPDNSWTAKRNQYYWKNLSIADTTLTPHAKEFIASLTDEKIDQIIKIWREDLPKEFIEDFFTPLVLKNFKDRILILRKFKDDNLTLEDLGNINTLSAIKNYLKKEVKSTEGLFSA